MRRVLTAVLLAGLSTMPLSAQSGMRVAPGFAARGSFAHPGLAPGGIHVRGGFGFGHNPRIHVFFGPNRFFRQHPFFRPFFRQPFLSPVPVYYSPFSYPVAADSGNAEAIAHEREALRAEVESLRAEVARLGEESYERSQPRHPESAESGSPSLISVPPEAAPPATLLVFRDGQHIETRNYAIVGQTLWVFSEQRARKYPLSSLDLANTVKLNEERGIKFHLPDSPQPVANNAQSAHLM